MKFIDLFAGLGGFHRALADLGHECVFASEIDSELRELYKANFPDAKDKTFGDIRECKEQVPEHDILCAGFPCQPFSKSGFQLGRDDETRGTLFDEILDVLELRKPKYIILENVGNFERHDNGRTWQIVKKTLRNKGYFIRGTEHITSGGPGLLSPHHLGFPHSRERFFIIGCLDKPLPSELFPPRTAKETTLRNIIQPSDTLSETDLAETQLTSQQLDCINHWNLLLSCIPESVELPSFPVWGDEIDATYPYNKTTPFAMPLDDLLGHLNGQSKVGMTREQALALLPSYARRPELLFPDWKQTFIRQNRDWLTQCREYMPEGWVEKLRQFPPSLRKLEWNCKGEERDLWKHVLQFRPSGLRVKRLCTSPALVAMTSTQIPILGPEKRFLTRIEGLRLQGFPDDHLLPSSRTASFKALGNAVHTKVIREIAVRFVPMYDLREENCSNHEIDQNVLLTSIQLSLASLQRPFASSEVNA